MAFALTDLTNSYELSSEGTLSIGGEVLGGFKSGSLSFSADTIDNATRDDQGWTKPAPGNRSASLEVTWNKLETDACQVGLRSYIVDSDFQTKGVAVVYRSESKTTAPGDGFKGLFIMTNYSENQGMDGTAVECSATFASWGPIVSDTSQASGNGN